MKGYLSGQITNLTQEEFARNFQKASFVALADGYEPVNPLNVRPCDDEECGGGKTLPDGQQFHEYSCYMKYDILAELQCDAIFMLPNWENSSGARFERQVAIMCGINVFYITAEYDGVMS